MTYAATLSAVASAAQRHIASLRAPSGVTVRFDSVTYRVSFPDGTTVDERRPSSIHLARSGIFPTDTKVLEFDAEHARAIDFALRYVGTHQAEWSLRDSDSAAVWRVTRETIAVQFSRLDAPPNSLGCPSSIALTLRLVEATPKLLSVRHNECADHRGDANTDGRAADAEAQIGPAHSITTYTATLSAVSAASQRHIQQGNAPSDMTVALDATAYRVSFSDGFAFEQHRTSDVHLARSSIFPTDENVVKFDADQVRAIDVAMRYVATHRAEWRPLPSDLAAVWRVTPRDIGVKLTRLDAPPDSLGCSSSIEIRVRLDGEQPQLLSVRHNECTDGPHRPAETM